MSSKVVDIILKSKLFLSLLIIAVIVSSSVILLTPVEPSTPSFGRITIPDKGTFNLNEYPYLERRVIGLWNSLRDFYSATDFSNESIHDLSILPDVLTQYFLAFTVYGMAQIVDSTPNYRSSYYKQLFDKIILMMNSTTMEQLEWIDPGYAEDHYSDLGNGFRGPTNIMWTGHYALMELLYYNTFRDPKYNDEIKWYMDDWNRTLSAEETWDNQTSKDGSGRPLGQWGTGLIPCEPYIVFVQCNSIPFYAMRMYDELHETNYQDVTLAGIDWWQTHMTDDNGIQIDGYYVDVPHETEGLPERLADNIPGPALTYGKEVPKVASYGSAWAIMFYEAFGKDSIAQSYYDDFKKMFVYYTVDDMAYTPDSYYYPSNFGLYDLIGTLFTYFCTREMEDDDLFQKIENWYYGPFPGYWDEYNYRFDTSALGDLGPFMDPILSFAYAWSHADSTLSDLMDPRSDSFYNSTPFISEESSTNGLFIYQACFDEEKEVFILTVEANEETKLTFSQFPNVQGVYTKSGEYQNWSQNGDQMELTLSKGTHSFVII
ncbi:MAG: hypothetical protein JSV04_10905 [Candidatus Heimdallarchaeota archaeon]|nr:MAG: hypothetical protein JSV04_10905 [Candidatus Heimdallarchaeota archaeon]